MGKKINVITGAFTYTGRYISKLLIEKGELVRNITNHPNRPHDFGNAIESVPMDFSNPDLLAETMAGADTFYCTYWVRFDEYGPENIRDTTVANVKKLVDAARKAGVRKIVFTSHTKTSIDSPFPYIRGKARCEAYIRGSGVSYGFVKPCAIFGDTPDESIIINNIAYLLRKMPAVLVPGSGNYPLHPVHVRDMAEMCVELGESDKNGEIDAVGPEKLSFIEILRMIRAAVNTRCLIVPYVPEALIFRMVAPVNKYFGDILIDKYDIQLMRRSITSSDDVPPKGKRALSAWVYANRETLGKNYISSIERYYPADMQK